MLQFQVNLFDFGLVMHLIFLGYRGKPWTC